MNSKFKLKIFHFRKHIRKDHFDPDCAFCLEALREMKRAPSLARELSKPKQRKASIRPKLTPEEKRHEAESKLDPSLKGLTDGIRAGSEYGGLFAGLRGIENTKQRKSEE